MNAIKHLQMKLTALNPIRAFFFSWPKIRGSSSEWPKFGGTHVVGNVDRSFARNRCSESYTEGKKKGEKKVFKKGGKKG